MATIFTLTSFVLAGVGTGLCLAGAAAAARLEAAWIVALGLAAGLLALLAGVAAHTSQ